MRIGAGLVGLGLFFVILVGLDAVQGRSARNAHGMLWTAAFIAVTGSVLAANGVRRTRARCRVLTDGLPTEATVTAVTPSRMQATVRDAPAWMIRYRYADGRGRMLKGQSWDLSQEEAENWKAGDTAMIRFDGRHPSTSAWTGERSGSPARAGSGQQAPHAVAQPPSLFKLAKRVPAFWIGPLFFIFGLMALASGDEQVHSGLFLLPGLLLFLAGLRRIWIWHRLVGLGVPATGIVSAVKRALLGSDRAGRGVSEWQWVVRYRYDDDIGNTHQGRSGYLSSTEASRSRVGDPCDIRIDRERPARSVWIGAVAGVSGPQ
jgi:hypothetical protein